MKASANRTLLDWVSSYELSHDLAGETAAYYRRSIRTLEGWAGRKLDAKRLTDDLINGTLWRMLMAGKSPHYVRSLKSGVLAVWRDMADAGRCAPPRRIRPIRSPPPPIRVWTPEEVRRLVAAADRLPGRFRTLELDRAAYFSTMIRTAWDTALRRRDLQRLRRKEIGPEWHQRQGKTGRLVLVRLRPSTLVAIDRWGRPLDAILWPPWGSDESFRITFRRIVLAAGIPLGPWKQIRKSAGTAAEAVSPGAGHILLGNTRRVFERHYLAGGSVAGPQPPDLEG